MKQVLCFFIAAMLFTSCQSQQSKAMNDQQKAHDELEKISPDNVRTTEGGWTMTCTVNGKLWKASSMFPQLDAAGRIIGYLKDESISLPYRKSKLKTGATQTFSNNNAVDILGMNGVPVWGGYEGGMTITKADNDWIEGTFTVTAHDGGKTLIITDGRFKIKAGS